MDEEIKKRLDSIDEKLNILAKLLEALLKLHEANIEVAMELELQKANVEEMLAKLRKNLGDISC